jgi:hypothetical protein
LSAIPVSAFVSSLTVTGKVKHWDLISLPAGVSTNIVNPVTRSIRYYLASDGWSASNTAAELNAVRASFDQWQAVPGTILKFEFAGFVAPGVDINTSDHSNVIFWAKSSTLVNGGLSDISGALGSTYTTWNNASGAFLEADIVLNGVESEWYTDFVDTSGRQFVEGTVLHEIGHFIGFDHSPLGGATMFSSSAGGLTPQVGLSTDEIFGARFKYPQANQAALLGTLSGQIRRSGIGILGAAIIAEDLNGTAVAGTVSRDNGAYELSALPPGNYLVRVTPLDSTNNPDYLVRGSDIAPSYLAAEISFLPTTNTPATVTAGVTNTLNFAVANAEPAFRITDMRNAGSANTYSWAGLPIMLRQGQSNFTVGVASSSLPTNNATLTITGDGLTVGPPVFRANAFGSGLNFISVNLSVASSATPGLRSFIVRQGANLAYANGFLDIAPAHPDYNFDGLDDSFQRQYFPLWTAPSAAPDKDPDGDGFDNAAEYVAGTSPTDMASVLKIDQVTQTMAGTTMRWRSVVGKQYRVHRRDQFGAGNWQAIGSSVTATGVTAQYFDAGASNTQRYYRVEVLSRAATVAAVPIILYQTGWEPAPANPAWALGAVSPQNGWQAFNSTAGHQVVANGSSGAVVGGQAVVTPYGTQFHKFTASSSTMTPVFRDSWPDITSALAALPSTHKIFKASIDVFVPSAQDGVAAFYGIIAYHDNGSSAPWGAFVDPSDHSINLFLDDDIAAFVTDAFQLDTWFKLQVTADYLSGQVSVEIDGVNLPQLTRTSTMILQGSLTDVDLATQNYSPPAAPLRVAFSDNFLLTAESAALPSQQRNGISP